MAELLEVAGRVAAQARAGEEIEAYVVRARDTSVRVYEGEVEQLSAAQSEGIGVRVIANGCQGFAYAGSLDPDAVADALAEARDNVSFGTPDEWAQLARPDGVDKAVLDLWRPELEHTTTASKVALATELERLARSGDSRVAVESADYADMLAEDAVVTSTGIRATSRESGCYLSISTLATDGDETQTGFG